MKKKIIDELERFKVFLLIKRVVPQVKKFFSLFSNSPSKILYPRKQNLQKNVLGQKHMEKLHSPLKKG